MPQFLTTATLLECSMGAMPTPFIADELPAAPKEVGLTSATVVQIVPGKNITPFGMCKSPANPTVASATAAAQGVLTPMPCTPTIPAPWAPPSVCTKHMGIPMATAQSVCACAFGGVVKVSQAMPAPGNTL
ncbi:PAAR-like protein [Bosea sp. BK604]|uniref:PAAR-like protein n=1 Tax=Bosea sp. BK604 TaxID=2512180 RepID=UPI0010ED1C27|nr:PAAR-like protein [Bosea sp. BK604]TCR69760.1 uncharacterized protein DUF4280 [Bosea sp. BK604]